jgi:hypothetical protein
MATTQSIRALANYQYMHDGRLPDHFPQRHVQTKLEKYAMAMRYATGIVEYYKENYSYPEVQYQMSENFKNGGYFETT